MPIAVTLEGPEDPNPLQAYTLQEAARIFRERPGDPSGPRTGRGKVVLGTPDSNWRVERLIQRGYLQPLRQEQSYTLFADADPDAEAPWLLAVAGADDRGVLYGLRDLEHFCMDRFSLRADGVHAERFRRTGWPRIEHRGHWVWGCNMPDKTAWMDNMSRWKLNELIHWDNFPPARGREYVEFAHSRGLALHWGFGWGWGHWNVQLPPDFVPGEGGAPLCPSNEFDRAFYRRAILDKVRTLYAPTGCDGIYFQSFTEFPKCTCPRCAPRSMGQLMVEFCNPILADLFAEFPRLWVSCGIHANFGQYDFLRDLDPRCNIYWENCDSGTSVRGDDEDFGYINKTLPYAHGFGPDCPADPEWTEESLAAWMASNAERYRVEGPIESCYNLLAEYQRWAARLLGKPSARKHASTVADHSVFCRRTPFFHAALAEAQWNPHADTRALADALVRFLGLDVRITGAPWTPTAASVQAHTPTAEPRPEAPGESPA